MLTSKYRQLTGFTLSSEDWQEGVSEEESLISPSQLAALLSTSSGGSSFTTVEVDLGSKPTPNGSFNIAGSGLSPGKVVMISQAALPYTGKGTLADEIEMDQIIASGYVQDASTIVCHWGSGTKVRGNVKFNYMVSA